MTWLYVVLIALAVNVTVLMVVAACVVRVAKKQIGGLINPMKATSGSS